MKKSPLMIAAAAALLSAAAGAVTSSPSEFRGYQACLDANEGDFQGLVTDRNYLIREEENSRTYYINATAWENGERVEVGFSCETTRSGKLLSNQGASHTQYAAAPDDVQVAGN
jgi:hypothetical protein